MLQLGLSLKLVRYGTTTRHHGGSLQLACKRSDRLVTPNKRIRTLLRDYGLVRVLNYLNVDPFNGWPALAFRLDTSIDMKESLG